jgi:hypothetical protein
MASLQLDCDMIVLGPTSLQQGAIQATVSLRALSIHERSQQGMATISNAAAASSCAIGDPPTQTLQVLVEVALDDVCGAQQQEGPCPMDSAACSRPRSSCNGF